MASAEGVEPFSPFQMISTPFEAGIGRRFVEHLSSVQIDGTTPSAHGLASGWTPYGPLFAADP